MNEVIAAVVLFGVVTAVFAPLIAESGRHMFSTTTSISDLMESSKHRTGQIVVATNIQQQDDTITVFVSNIGVEAVEIKTVLVDGARSHYVLKNQDSVPVQILQAGELGMLEVAGAGDAIQIILRSGKFLEFLIP